MAIIEIDDLTKKYGKTVGIDSLDLSIEEGESFGIIGSDGAGRSTVVRILAGLISPTAGQVKIFGKDITEQKKEILQDIGYIPSVVSFYDNMKVGELIAFSAKMRRKDHTDGAKELCQRFSIDPKWRIDQLTLNGRKKVAIICALQHRPRLYILDEPTAGLDPLAQKEFFSILRERRLEGATVFLSTKILSEIRKECSRAAIIKEGRLIAVDDVKNMAAAGARRITLYGITSVPEIPGIASLEKTNDYVTFLYNGDIKEMLRVTASLPIYDISIGEQVLDGSFIEYYEVGKESI